MNEADLAIVAKGLCRDFTVFHKEEGIWASLRGFLAPKTEIIHAVKELDLEIRPGEIVGFLGPNGAGKSTTLKMFSGLISPSCGELAIGPYDPFRRDRQFLRQISLVMGQKQNLWWDLPPLETLAIHREIYEIGQKEFETRRDDLVEMLEIRDCITVQARKLSLGQRMRCELAVALLHQPAILFLDEPTIGLDILMQRKVRKFLKDYHRRFQPTIILTSHYMEDVAALAQRVIVINQGGKIFDDSLSVLAGQAQPDRNLTVTFHSIPENFSAADFGELLESVSTRFTIRVPRKDAPHAASRLYATGRVADLTIEESPLEDVIAKLFAKGGKE